MADGLLTLMMAFVSGWCVMAWIASAKGFRKENLTILFLSLGFLGLAIWKAYTHGWL
jgi:hypothetical protein